MPFLEARVTGDHEVHHLLGRPRDHPVRTAFGAATLSFYTVLFLAAGTDVLATTFGLAFETLLRTFQVGCIAVPLIVGWITWRICKELSRQHLHPIGQPVGGTVVRSPEGGYQMVGTEAPAADPDG